MPEPDSKRNSKKQSPSLLLRANPASLYDKGYIAESRRVLQRECGPIDVGLNFSTRQRSISELLRAWTRDGPLRRYLGPLRIPRFEFATEAAYDEFGHARHWSARMA